MFITGPAVIKQVTGEVITPEQLGGARAQMNNSGVVHFVAENDVEAIKICKRLLSFLPSNNLEEPPRGRSGSRRLATIRSERHRARRTQAALRHARDHHPRSWIAAISWKCRRISPRTW